MGSSQTKQASETKLRELTIKYRALLGSGARDSDIDDVQNDLVSFLKSLSNKQDIETQIAIQQKVLEWKEVSDLPPRDTNRLRFFDNVISSASDIVQTLPMSARRSVKRKPKRRPVKGYQPITLRL